ncbi:MAG TPA: class I adenylate-forming enzyme family protein [Sedimentisphaerales bacterium]|nr:class I adenylate-forming enzyme family protein [Sedimentisphaerales bacterium]
MQKELKFRTLIDVFNESLAEIEFLDKKCLEIIRADREESLTFEQLKARARDFAVWLIRSQNIRIADKVAILGKNRADWDVALWGVILAGAIPVLIDPERPVEGVINHLTHTESRLIVMADDYQDAESRRELKDFAAGRGMVFIEMTVYEETGLSYNEIDELLNKIPAGIDTDDTAVILCTSGTTGDPREVELTHRNLGANLLGSVQKVKISHKDTLGHILPPHHSFGLTVGKLLPFCVGATNVYTNKYRQMAELIRDKEITIFVAVPALYTMLAKNFEESLAKEKKKKPHVKLLDRHTPKLVGKRIIKKLGWSKIRFFLSGSAPIPEWVLDVFWRRGMLLYEGYGTTENSPVYGFNEEAGKLGSVGKPINTIFVKIVNEDNQELPPGEKGEIALGGPCIMEGYYKNPKATEAVIKTDEGGVRWLLTGDLGHLDKDGNLYITGRKKYVIVLPGGKNVSPEHVESALSQAKFVGEILVVTGFRKDQTGIVEETIRAIVRPAWDAIETHANHSSDDLVDKPQVLKNLIWRNINECQQNSRQLSSFEKISSQHLEIRIEEFQKTSTGKIRREAYMKV